MGDNYIPRPELPVSDPRHEWMNEKIREENEIGELAYKKHLTKEEQMRLTELLDKSDKF